MIFAHIWARRPECGYTQREPNKDFREHKLAPKAMGLGICRSWTLAGNSAH